MKKLFLILLVLSPIIAMAANDYPYLTLDDTLPIGALMPVDSTTRPMNASNTWDNVKIVTFCSASGFKVKYHKKYTNYAGSIADSSLLHITPDTLGGDRYYYAKLPIKTIVGTGTITAAESTGLWTGTIIFTKDEYEYPIPFGFHLAKSRLMLANDTTRISTDAASKAATAILATPANKLATDGSGRVTLGDSTSVVAPLLAYLPDSTRDVVGDSVKMTPARLAQFDSLTNNRITHARAKNLDSLDAKISSRSTLVTTDNIGINWADISNPSTSVDLSNTKIERADTAYYHSAAQNTLDSLKNYQGIGLLLTSIRLSKLDSLHFVGDSVKATGGSGSGMSLAQFIAWAESDTGLVMDSSELAAILIAYAGGAALDSTDSIALGRWVYQYTSGSNRLARFGDSTTFQGAAAGLDSGVVDRLLNARFTATEADSILARLLSIVYKTDSLRFTTDYRLLVTVDSILASAVNSNAFASNAITSAKINDGAITGTKIATGALDSSKFGSSYYDSVSAMLGGALSNWSDSLRDTTVAMIKKIMADVAAKAIKYNLFQDSTKRLLVDNNGWVAVFDIDKNLEINLADGGLGVGDIAAGAIDSPAFASNAKIMFDRHSQDTVNYVTVGAAATLTDSLVALIATRARDTLLLTLMQPGWPQSGDTLSAWIYHLIAAVVDKTIGVGATVDNMYSDINAVKDKTDSMHFKADSILASGGGGTGAGIGDSTIQRIDSLWAIVRDGGLTVDSFKIILGSLNRLATDSGPATKDYWTKQAMINAGSDTAIFNSPKSDSALNLLMGQSGVKVDFKILSATDSSEIEDARISVFTLAGTEKLRNITTDVTGSRQAFLDTSSYQVIVRHNSYATRWDTLPVTGAMTDTIYMTAYQFAPPIDGNHTVCYIDVGDLVGTTKLTGWRLSATPTGNYYAVTGGRMYPQQTYTAMSDTNGRIQLNLLQTEVAAPHGTDSLKYVFKLEKVSTGATINVTSPTRVPTSTPFKINTWLYRR